MFNHILCPTDGSPPALKAARVALEISRKYGAALTVLNVAPIRILDLMAPRGSLGPEPLMPKEMEVRLTETSHRLVQQTLTSLGEGAQGVAAREIMGHPADEICRIAEEESFDLVVMGSRGQSSLQRAVLGSVSDYVVRHCHCPVLIVKND